jgi:hypothetical protein
MHYQYFSSINDQDYLGRILIFVKRNIWLYIPDFVLVLFLVLPPYSWHEALLVIGISLVLSIRDVCLLIYSVNHLGKFIIDGDSVSIAVLRKSELQRQYSGSISEFDIKVKGKLFFKKTLIIKNNEVIHYQYAIGNWSPKKMDELYEHFYNVKRDIGFWKIFKGPMVN